MQKHIRILGYLYLGSSAFFLVLSLLIFTVLNSVNSPGTVSLTEGIFYAVGVFLILLALPGFIIGVGLLRRLPWARIAALVIAIFNLFNFPLGTILAVYTFWVLIQYESTRIFNPRESDSSKMKFA